MDVAIIGAGPAGSTLAALLAGRGVPVTLFDKDPEPVIFRARSPVEHGVFMVGDASGVIDPLTGNGMARRKGSARHCCDAHARRGKKCHAWPARGSASVVSYK